MLVRGALACTTATAACTTAMTSSQVSPSTLVNIASVRFGSPDARTTRTASATSSPTSSPTPSGVTLNATRTDMPLKLPGLRRTTGGDEPGPEPRGFGLRACRLQGLTDLTDQTIDDLLARLAGAGDVLMDRPAAGSGHQPEIDRLVAAFPLVKNAPDWLSFLARYGGVTFVRPDRQMSAGLFGVSRSASLHVLDGEGDPVDQDCLLFCDMDGSISSPDDDGFLAYGFDATGTRPWGVYAVTRQHSEWYAPTFLEWLTRFVDSITG